MPEQDRTTTDSQRNAAVWRASLFGLPFTARVRRPSCVLLALTLGVSLLQCLSPLWQRQLLDMVNSRQTRLALIALAVVAAMQLAVFAISMAERWLYGVLRVRLTQIMKQDVFRHLLQLPEDFLRSRGAGYFFNRVQADISEVLVFVYYGAIGLWGTALSLCLSLFLLWRLEWRCAVLVLPFLLLQVVVCLCFRQRQYRLSKQIQENVATERYVMQDFLSQHSMLKTHVASQEAGSRIEDGQKHWGDLVQTRLKNENWFRLWLQLPIWLCRSVVAVIGICLVSRGQDTLGNVWAILLLLSQVFAPARMISDLFVRGQASRAAWTRLKQLLLEATEDEPRNCQEPVPDRLQGDVVLSALRFNFGDRELLKDVNLRVPQGTLCFIVGKNGSGKSTLLSLLLRLYSPLSGSITIGGRAVKDFPLAAYRSRIGYVGQQPSFLCGTVRDNLLLGNPRKCSDEEIWTVLRRLDSETVVSQRSGALSATVAEGGSNFSGGEKLRLTLARELLRDTDVLLLDEPAAALDPQSRQVFYRLLQKLPGSLTVLAVVHDLPEETNCQVFSLD